MTFGAIFHQGKGKRLEWTPHPPPDKHSPTESFLTPRSWRNPSEWFGHKNNVLLEENKFNSCVQDSDLELTVLSRLYQGSLSAETWPFWEKTKPSSCYKSYETCWHTRISAQLLCVCWLGRTLEAANALWREGCLQKRPTAECLQWMRSELNCQSPILQTNFWPFQPNISGGTFQNAYHIITGHRNTTK